ncbi:ABC transporter permease subunit [Chelatococcus sambhunathii]|uniref:ABC transporter permease subunit n=1 Tax=Chelatococcus sambhunathii TaxID=363953 RepID=A0ABU1DC80_9HYPH|nr:ABC transporter permease subunit [Chelatococcus sambhunathii]MDR4305716.1 ABC transporter permease subunit [Chelatococcus sambhunathii]
MTETVASKPEGTSPWGRRLVVAVPYLWLLVLFLTPFLIVLKISFSNKVVAQPPYEPQLDLAGGWQAVKDFFAGLSLDNYYAIFEYTENIEAYFSSLKIAATATILMLLIAYPMAYAMARAPKTIRPTLVMAVILPFWTSLLIRVYAWIGILDREGLLNASLQWLGIIDEPLEILHTEIAVYIGMVYSYLPFMVLPLYASLEKLDETLLEAAADLGCPPWKSFWQVTVPLSLPGVIAGCFLVFIPAVGEFVIPELLGGSGTYMIGQALYAEFFPNLNWPGACAIAVLLLLVLVVPIAIYQNVQTKEIEGRA